MLTLAVTTRTAGQHIVCYQRRRWSPPAAKETPPDSLSRFRVFFFFRCYSYWQLFITHVSMKTSFKGDWEGIKPKETKHAKEAARTLLTHPTFQGSPWGEQRRKKMTPVLRQVEFWLQCLRDKSVGGPEGWDGAGDGRGVQDGGHIYIHGWCMAKITTIL